MYVNYTVLGKDYQAGPYNTEAEADDHRRDIAIYEGVSRCWITPHRDPKRQLMGGAE